MIETGNKPKEGKVYVTSRHELTSIKLCRFCRMTNTNVSIIVNSIYDPNTKETSVESLLCEIHGLIAEKGDISCNVGTI